MSINALYEGTAIKIKGKEYIVPGLSLGQLETLGDKMDALETNQIIGTKEAFQTIAEIIHAAMSRNYPEMTLADIKEMIDIRNMKQFIKAVKGESGLVVDEAGKVIGDGAESAPLKSN